MNREGNPASTGEFPCGCYFSSGQLNPCPGHQEWHRSVRVIELRESCETQQARRLLQESLKGLRVLRTIGQARSYKDRDKAITDWGKPIFEATVSLIEEIDEYLLETGKVVQST